MTAGNVLQGLHASNEDGKIVLDLSFAHPVSNPPSAFTMTRPTRLVLDFLQTRSLVSSSPQTFKLPPLEAVSAQQGQGKTRLIIQLSEAAHYSTQLLDRHVLVTLQPAR